MPQTSLTLNVRHISPTISIIDIQGDVTMLAEQLLLRAYAEAALLTTRTILLHCSGMSYLNSGGIGLLIVLLRSAHRQNQRLLCCGLNEHYRQIWTLTRLGEVLPLYESEADALAAAQ